MSGMSGLDRYLEPPSCNDIEVELTDVVCKECGLEQDVVCHTHTDECEWECAECDTLNTSYWDDDPINGRGWF